MKAAGGGSIINVSSYSAVSGWKEEVHYCASKWGFDGFSRALAVEAIPYNIAVNALDTGKVKFKKTSWTDEYFASLPVDYRARFADSSLVAPAFVYLAMQRANGVTGGDSKPMSSPGESSVRAGRSNSSRSSSFATMTRWASTSIQLRSEDDSFPGDACSGLARATTGE